MIKKIFITLALLFTGFLLISCEKEVIKPPTPEPEFDDLLTDPLYDDEITVSYVHTDKSTNLTYLMVEDKPFLYTGASIRVDALMNTDKFDYDFIEELFVKSKELGVKSLQIPVEWKDLELEEDVWDFTYVDKMLRFAVKNDLKIEFLWFGTNMTGDTHSYTVPDYILRDGKTYPKLDAQRTGEFWNYYGIQWYLIFNNPELLAREINAVNMLMDYVWEWDRTHGAKHPLVGMQIHNEVDLFVRYRTDQYNIQSPEGRKITYEEGWDMIFDAINQIGLAVKDAKYKVYTRTNYASSTAGWHNGTSHGIYDGEEVKEPPSWAIRGFNLPGIDIVGDDSYRAGISDIKGISSMYGAKLPGNFSHIAENNGDYDNTASLILTALSQNAGYSLYDLFTSPFYIRHGSESVDQGIFLLENGKLINKPHFNRVQGMLEIINKAWKPIVQTHQTNFAAFNLKDNNPSLKINQTISTTHVETNFSTENSALAFLLSSEEYVYVASTEQSNMNFSNINISKVDKGYFNQDGDFVSEGIVNTTNNNLDLDKGSLYRITISDILSSLISDTWNHIG